jgi:hypothetical protein
MVKEFKSIASVNRLMYADMFSKEYRKSFLFGKALKPKPG